MQWANILYFLVWAVLIFFMMRFGCGAHVMGHGRGHGTSSPEHGAGGSAALTQAVDPVCGMTVETATAKSAMLGDRPYYFCSTNCRTKFEAAPATYTASAPASLQRKEHRHGC